MNTRLSSWLVVLALSTSFLPAGCAGAPAGTPGPEANAASGLSDLPVEILTAELGTAEAAAEGDAPPRLPTLSLKGQSYRPWHMEFASAEACEAFAVPGVHLLTRFEKWADVFIPTSGPAYALTLRAKGLVRLEGGYPSVSPPPPAAPVAGRGIPEITARGGLGTLKGKGVVVAIVDSGLDFRHPDFISLDAGGQPVSRVLAFWDTASTLFAEKGVGSKAPVTWPDGTSHGTVFTREQLTAELRAPVKTIGVSDANGHGTACASIAAGNGRGHSNPAFAGVAPEADIIAVRIGATPSPQLENVYLLGPICAWIDAVAAKQPCVVSCSLGGQYGGRDGQRVLERQLNARFPSSAKGRTLCIAAGNEGANGLHAGAVCGTAAKPARIEWRVHPGTQGQVELFFASPNGADLFFSSGGADAVDVKNFAANLNPFTRHVSVQLAATSAGSYALNLWTASGTPVEVDAYLAWGAVPTSAGTILKPVVFTGSAATARKQIATPGSVRQAITVGSYDFNDLFDLKGGKATWGNKAQGVAPLTLGSLSPYSNPGPLRAGDAVKPELVAPGRFHPVSLAQGTKPGLPIEKSEKYWYMNGTSSATPYVAGVVALLFQKNPGLTLGEVKTLLASNLSRDAYTGTLPNPGWGHGKLDLKAVKAVLAAVKAP